VNQRGHNLLILAARRGCTSICRTLIKKGADVNQQVDGKDYSSPLQAAAHRGHTETVKYLLEAGADVNMTVKRSNLGTPLIAALTGERIETAKFLIQEAGADVNKTHIPEDKEDEGFEPVVIPTPVALAAEIKGTGLLKFLVDAGANANVSQQSGNPLCLAIQSGNIQGAKYLIQEAEVDANLPISDSSFCAYLQLAATENNNFEIVKCLVEAGAEVNSLECGDMGIPLAAAVYGSSNGSIIDILKYLIEAGADIHKGNDGKHLVRLAVSAQDIEVVKFLIEAGAELHVQEESNAAIRSQFLKGVRYMIQKGADVN
jgi:ankyrin repeat protein